MAVAVFKPRGKYGESETPSRSPGCSRRRPRPLRSRQDPPSARSGSHRGVGHRRPGNRDSPRLHAGRIADAHADRGVPRSDDPTGGGRGRRERRGAGCVRGRREHQESNTAIADAANSRFATLLGYLRMSAPLSAKVQPTSTPLTAVARRCRRALHRIAGGPRASTGLRFRSTPKAACSRELERVREECRVYPLLWFHVAEHGVESLLHRRHALLGLGPLLRREVVVPRLA